MSPRSGEVTLDHVEATLWRVGLSGTRVDAVLAVVRRYGEVQRRRGAPSRLEEAQNRLESVTGEVGRDARVGEMVSNPTRVRLSTERLVRLTGEGQLKVCVRCRARVPVAEFYRDANKVDGRRSSCKTCDKEARLLRRGEVDHLLPPPGLTGDRGGEGPGEVPPGLPGREVDAERPSSTGAGDPPRVYKERPLAS